MVAVATSRPFEPGTTGWTASDLDDPQIEQLWLRGRYEIIEGVLTTMAPAYFDGGNSALTLLSIMRGQIRKLKLGWRGSIEVDIVIDDDRVLRADAIFMTPLDRQAQLKAFQDSGRLNESRTRILVPPAFVLESISPGHERHDDRTKRAWYAEFGVTHYWILNAFTQSLTCLRLQKGKYVVDASGEGNQTIHPSIFPKMKLPLKRLWTE